MQPKTKKMSENTLLVLIYGAVTLYGGLFQGHLGHMRQKSKVLQQHSTTQNSKTQKNLS